MKNLSIDQIAKSLENLSTKGLLNYIKEQERWITNELRYGRSAVKYKRYLKAGKLALDVKINNK